MVVRPIRIAPDPVLRQKARRVRNIDGSVRTLITDMIETMHEASGVGLAAPQVGVPLRVIVIGLPGQEDFALINPEVVRRKGERVVTEGCLSIPGYIGQLKRSETVTVKGRDPEGKEVRLKADELLAQALEHEIDHVNGILYVDRLESEDDLRKIEPEELRAGESEL
jgi:peptide deformylase